MRVIMVVVGEVAAVSGAVMAMMNKSDNSGEWSDDGGDDG